MSWKFCAAKAKAKVMGGNGSGGHNRKSIAQKLAEGNRGKRPLNLREPKALPGEPQMPSGMTEQARAVWPEVVAVLKANDVLFKTDGLAIATLCSNLVLFWQADRAVQEMGSMREKLEGSFDATHESCCARALRCGETTESLLATLRP
jgi:phage terminase small subunit